MSLEDQSPTRREARLAREQAQRRRGTDRPDGVRSRGDRAASVLFVAAAVSVALGGVVLALGFPAPHTLLVYAAVALGGLGVLLALPRVLSTVPFDPDRPMPRRRADD